MSKKYGRFLKWLNKALYISSAALLIAGAILTAFPQAASADKPVTAEMQLNLSHIYCEDEKVEVHFVLLNAPDGVTPGNLTFTLKINGGTEVTHTIAPSSHTGNVWHFYYYGMTNGYYNVTSASVTVGSTTVSLHNPGVYSGSNNTCVVTPDLCVNLDGIQSVIPAGYEDPDNDGVCTSVTCNDETANNFGEIGACTYDTCDDEAANNFGEIGACTYDTCDDEAANNFGEIGACTYDTCNDEAANNFGEIGACTYDTCDDEAANNFGEIGACTYDTCDDETANNFGEIGACTYDTCDDETANNFGEIGACTYDTCNDETANNFGEIGACTYDTCDDEAANNFGEIGACTYDTCDDEAANNFGEIGACTYDTIGCKDPKATNYNPEADTADNSLCKYKKVDLPDPLEVAIDPYCNVDGQMVWTVINPNNTNVTMTHFIVDGESRSGFTVTPGEHFLTTTALGTHTVEIHFNEMATASLTWTINVCPLPIPVTGAEVLIPVTGADETSHLGMGLSFGGLSVVGLALLLSALRKMYHL